MYQYNGLFCIFWFKSKAQQHLKKYMKKTTWNRIRQFIVSFFGVTNGLKDQAAPEQLSVSPNKLPFAYVKNDPNAPVYFCGLYKGYLAIDTSQNSHYYWLFVIFCAVLYNIIFVVGRAIFWEMGEYFPVGWYIIDYTFDFVYIVDIFIRMHEGKCLIIYFIVSKVANSLTDQVPKIH